MTFYTDDFQSVDFSVKKPSVALQTLKEAGIKIFLYVLFVFLHIWYMLHMLLHVLHG